MDVHSLIDRWCLPFYLCFVFALAERKNETQKEDKVPLRKITSEPPRTSCNLGHSTPAPASASGYRRALPPHQWHVDGGSVRQYEGRGCRQRRVARVSGDSVQSYRAVGANYYTGPPHRIGDRKVAVWKSRAWTAGRRAEHHADPWHRVAVLVAHDRLDLSAERRTCGRTLPAARRRCDARRLDRHAGEENLRAVAPAAAVGASETTNGLVVLVKPPPLAASVP